MTFILLMVWLSYCLWYGFHTAYGMAFILLMVWPSYCLWYGFHTAYGMAFILLMVWIFGIITTLFKWYDYYTTKYSILQHMDAHGQVQSACKLFCFSDIKYRIYFVRVSVKSLPYKYIWSHFKHCFFMCLGIYMHGEARDNTHELYTNLCV